ncbi:MAG: septal ring lytic transglycosylase RlpA family protein [Sphingobacteriaceae bacterium]|nr:septal ring lytic transglycosylase RlpA family protein [Sphingobacteriaceae bacterium]
MKYIFAVLLSFAFQCLIAQENLKVDSTSTQKTNLDSLVNGKITQIGYATYYANKFSGRKTTSGERYRSYKFTAAHRTLPFGTIVTVTNLANNKSVDVRVNDRGPFIRKFFIDVSKAAAKEIGFFGKGVAQVSISFSPAP